jgi:myo-inositol 2-dehydrogenase / D-chiro-inositol 1-dehydrogenase
MTVRVGIVGTGMIGRDHARRLTGTVAGAEVTAVADVDAGRARAVAAGLPAARALPRGLDVVADAAVDAVLVTSSGPTHEEFVLAAIEAGKPVFCEKPLAPTADACLRVVRAEVARGRRLVQVGFMRRYDDGYRAMKEVVDSGGLGTPLMVHCVHRNVSVPVAGYTSDMAVTDTGVHEIDAVRWLLGDEIAAVEMRAPRRSGRAPEHLRDPQIILLETREGVHVDVEVYVNCGYGYDIRCEVVGESGTADLAGTAPVTVRAGGHRTAPVPAHWTDRFARAYDAEVREWVDSAARGAAAGPSAWDGYAATAVAAACLEARDGGRRVAVTLAERPALYA